MTNPKSRNIDSARRDDRRAGTVDSVEVTEVHPHVTPDDKYYNTVTIQWIDRYEIGPNGGPIPIIEKKHINLLQPYHGKYQGGPIYTPRIGDMVILFWIHDDEGIVLGSRTSVEQPPVCRSQADSQHQEYVRKLCPWKQPIPNCEGNYTEFPCPEHPDCYKWWPKTRDSIYIFDCPNGNAHPECDANTPCNCLDDLQQGTWIKNFSSRSPTQLDLLLRFKFHHHCGSIFYFDEDGTIHLENKTGGCDDGGSCDGATPRGQVHFFPTGTIIMRAEPQDEQGAQLRVVAKEDPDTVAVEMLWEVTGSYVRIMKDGSITLYSPTKITLDAPLVEETHDNKIDGDNEIIGFCDHNGCNCPT